MELNDNRIKAACIEWVDCSGHLDSIWTVPSKLSLLHITSIGIIADEGKDYVTIATSRGTKVEEFQDDSIDYAGLICIPKSAITKRTNLEIIVDTVSVVSKRKKRKKNVKQG